VTVDTEVNLRQEKDPAYALQDVLRFYDQDLDLRFLREGKAVYSGEYDMTFQEEMVATVSISRKRSIRDFFR
jgi:hypothetical protein